MIRRGWLVGAGHDPRGKVDHRQWASRSSFGVNASASADERTLSFRRFETRMPLVETEVPLRQVPQDDEAGRTLRLL